MQKSYQKYANFISGSVGMQYTSVSNLWLA